MNFLCLCKLYFLSIGALFQEINVETNLIINITNFGRHTQGI